MRLSQTPSSLLSLVFALLSNIDTAEATPYPKDVLHDLFGFGFLQDRSCNSYCGADNQYCCTAGQACYTNTANVAYCSASGGAVATGGGYAVYTTTYTETDLVLRTSTYSSWWTAAAETTSVYVAPTSTEAAPAICTTSLGESSCGTICCAENQRCAVANSCTAYTSTFYASSIPTSSYSAPLRPTSGATSGGVSTATSTVSATTTAPFIAPATASGSSLPIVSSSASKGLSAGAIAGIVIGVIAGIIILILICFCCIVKAGLDGLLAIFGLGKKKRRSTERVEVIEERYSHHGSGTASRRDQHSGWFGGGGSSRPPPPPKKKSSGLGGLGMVGAGLLGLAAVLGLKRKSDRKEKPPLRSDISSSYYTDSFTGTSASK